MMPQARAAVLQADPCTSKHATTLNEMQRMFAYLMVSGVGVGVAQRATFGPVVFIVVPTISERVCPVI